MRTLVVNIRLDPYDVYIGRAGHGHDGYFGNPFRLNPKANNRDQCLRKYQTYLLGRVATDRDFRRRILELSGKSLGCFCAPKGGLTGDQPHVCHGQVIAEWLDGFSCDSTAEGGGA